MFAQVFSDLLLNKGTHYEINLAFFSGWKAEALFISRAKNIIKDRLVWTFNEHQFLLQTFLI